MSAACDPYHSPIPDLGYMAWHGDAVMREKRGEGQRRCPMCGKWVWESSFKPDAPKSHARHLGGGHWLICGPDEPWAGEEGGVRWA